jgi:hypothetical protein
MIWFTCKQCGKTHGRPESSIGSMIFCDCGQGNLVPWESTTTEPETPLATEPPPVPPAAEVPTATPLPVSDALPEIPVRMGRRAGRRQRDPAFCFNHEAVASRHTCPDCGEAFCGDCVVTLQGATLCGPCKNYRIRKLTRPSRVSGMAVTSALMALLTCPLAICLCALAVSSRASWLGLLALAPQVAAFAFGALALRSTEADAQRSGRSLAITGMTTAVVAGVLTVVVAVLVTRPLG